MSTGKFHGRGTFCVVIRNMVDAAADRVATHDPGIIRLQHFRHHLDIRHPRIKPQIIISSVEDDRHPVVYG